MTSSQKQTSTTSGPHSNGFSDYIPEFLKDAGVKKGRWYQSSKARPEHLMKISLTADAQKVHACLELGTMAYQREDAVYTIRDGTTHGKEVPLTPGKIGAMLKIPKEHVFRAIHELEDNGLAERFLLDPARGQVKGNVGVRSWAIPRPVKENEKRGSRAAPFLDLDAEYKPLIRFINRFKLNLHPDEWGASRDSNLREALAAVAKLEEDEKAVVALLKGYGAQDTHNKEEINGNYAEEIGAVGRQVETTVIPRADDLPAYPDPVLDNPPEPQTPVEENPPEKPDHALEEVACITEILDSPLIQQVCVKVRNTIDPHFAQLIAANLRGAPLDGFEDLIRRKWEKITGTGLLLHLASQWANAYEAQERSEQKKADAAQREQQTQQSAFIRQLLSDWDKVPEEDRQSAREAWPEIDWPTS